MYNLTFIMDYNEINFVLNPVTDELREIIAALLGQIDFESFTDTKEGLKAYIQQPIFNEELMNETLIAVQKNFDSFNYSILTIKDKNWNAEWEKNFNPVCISGICRIHAPFHPKDNKYKYDLNIEPKMSFGTGHHDTTELMIKLMLDIDFFGQEVLDMGCGTGVLSILASLKNAKKILSIDIDNWAYENTIENAKRNNITNITTKKGDAAILAGHIFDTILANINRNILLNDIPIYVNSLKKNGCLILSGFYSQDLPVILEKAEQLGLKYDKHIESNNWIAIKLTNTTN